MSREWKPGDVGSFDSHDVLLSVVLRVASCGDVKHRGPGDAGCKTPHWHFATGGFTFYDEYIRPLVVISPEDREQVERLWRLEAAEYDSRRNPQPEEIANLQAALREFADPKPLIEEPTGLGAVVEDADGRIYTRYETREAQPWWQSAYGPEHDVVRRFAWSDIDAVKVKSEGVTES